MTMTTIEALFLSFTGAFFGTVFSHFFSAKRKRKDELVELRLKAYTDFIKAATSLIAARRLGRISDDSDELATLNDAKIRICICAEGPVVKALAEFWEHGGTLERESEILAFTRFCMQVRKNLGNKDREIHTLNLSQTLFKLQPDTYSFSQSKTK